MRCVGLVASLWLVAACSSDDPALAADAAPADAPGAVDQAADTDPRADAPAADRPAGDRSTVERGPAADAAGADAPVADATHGDALSAGDGAASCQQLEVDYATTLGRARECNPWTEMNECTKKIPGNLGCPCDTYVNSFHATELKQLFALTQQWAAAGCTTCSTPSCTPVAAGECVEEPNGLTGRCTDLATK